MTHDPNTGATRVVSDDARTITVVLYVLSGLGLFTGGLTTAAALIVGLVKRAIRSEPSMPVISTI